MRLAQLRPLQPLASARFEMRLFLACGGCHAFPRRSRSIPLIAVAVHARDVEEASRHAEGVSLAQDAAQASDLLGAEAVAVIV
jgi:hypothetical protein